MLERIIERKKREVANLSEVTKEGREPSNRFSKNLKDFSVIAEIKRKSPSKGPLREIADPVLFAKSYERGGASAISILTDKEGFGGDLQDLKSVSQNVSLPTLRKDFIIDFVQIAEAALCGAQAVLLIVAVLGKDLKRFIEETHRMGLEALCEVHSIEELEIAIDAGAEIIGVNNRDLKTFKVDLSVSERLAKYIPQNVIKVAESGIHTIEDASRMKQAGYDAILVGEALVSSIHPEKTLQEMIKCK